MPEYKDRNQVGKDSEVRAQHVISELPFVRSLLTELKSIAKKTSEGLISKLILVASHI